jgi:hypothetical protein
MSEKLCTLKKNRSEYYYSLGYSQGVQDTTTLLVNLTASISIPTNVNDNPKYGTSAWANYANGATTWGGGAWRSASDYTRGVEPTRATFYIYGLNDYAFTVTMDIYESSNSSDGGSASGSHLYTFTTRFKDGVVTNSGSVPGSRTISGYTMTFGNPTWRNVNTYTA